MTKKKYYAVAVGRKVGIFHSWLGPFGAKIQIEKYKKAVFKKFEKLTDAKKFVSENKLFATHDQFNQFTRKNNSGNSEKIKIFTDGCSLGNPGPGGYGVVIVENDTYKEFSGGSKHTTNNRMELAACIVGLKKIKKKAKTVDIYSDSKYVVNGICKGWAKKWRKNAWKKSNKEKAKNKDLWETLLYLCEINNTNFNWVKGHSGNFFNEKCDKLARLAAKKFRT